MAARKIVGIVVIVCVLLIGGSLVGKVTPISRLQAEPQSQGSPPFNQPNIGGHMKASPETTRAAERSITLQLEAFKHDDYVAASIYQSMQLRSNIGSPAAFRSMMNSSYPEFAHCAKVKYGYVLTDGPGHAEVQVTVTGENGLSKSVVYLMVKEDGIYRIGGVLGGATPRIASPSAELNL